MIGMKYREWLLKWKEAFAIPGYAQSLTLSIIMFIGAFMVNVYAIRFATERASNPVTDIVLSNTPVFEVDGLFVYGTLVFAVFSIFIVARYPSRIPFALKTIAIFWIIRSAFTSLTHTAPFDEHVFTDFDPWINKIFFGADRFFSAHVAMPFLGALAFWREKWIRYICLMGSAYFAVIVLLGHLHYSIDVAAAFFITYGIFDLAKWLFPLELGWFYREQTDITNL